MLAVDTNVVVRLLVKDEPTQSRRAASLFERESIFLPQTVLLETEWVLRYAYERTRLDIGRALRALVGLPNVTVEGEAEVANALASFDAGLDFADALHLASSSRAERFATLDKTLIKRAKGRSATALVAA